MDGKANKALVAFLAKPLGVSKSDTSVAQGEKSRIKALQITGVSDQEILVKMEEIIST